MSPVPHTSDAILTLILFLISNIAVIAPFRLLIPRVWVKILRRCFIHLRILPTSTESPRRFYIHGNYITVPLVSVLLLLAIKSIDGTTLRRGILGADGVEPLGILALFLSLAYISISLDFTGLFRFSAFWVARRGGNSGQKLYFLLYLFFLLCGILVGNDPVILCGTPFLAYLTRVSGIAPPTAWLFSQFAAANMASVVLVSSNPTNLVLTGAFGISFIAYTAHVIVPFLAAATFVYPLFTLGLFRSTRLIPPSLDLNLSNDENESALVDRSGAIFGSALMLITLAVLAGTSTIGVPVWQVTIPAAVVMLLRDMYHDWSYTRTQDTSGPDTIPTVYELHEVSIPVGTISAQTLLSSPPSPTPPNAQRFDLVSLVGKHAKTVSNRFPTVSTILTRLPVPVLPFAFLMFILIQGLSTKGWIELFATWWDTWARHTGTIGVVGGMGFVSCILCNFCGTNIGATILLARIIQIWSTNNVIDPRARDGAIYALALGSNFGAFTLTLSASLAGLLWRGILHRKGIHIRPKQFMLLNLPISFVAMLVGCGVLVAEVYIIHK